MNVLPRLYKSRHGVYYFRLTQNKKKVRWSLNTKDFSRAKIAALALNLQIEMTSKPFDIDQLRKLEMEQVYEEDGIWVFDIQRAKNANSVRKIPLHKQLVHSNFLDYVKSLKEKKETMLFPHLVETKNGFSKNTSRKFGLW